MAQAQGVDREPPARLGREKRRDGLGRCRQGGLAMLVTPVGKAGDGGAVGAPCVVGAGGAAVIGGGGLGLGKTQCRRRQLDNGLELEPVADFVRIGAAWQARREGGTCPLAAKGAIAVSSPNSPSGVIGFQLSIEHVVPSSSSAHCERTA